MNTSYSSFSRLRAGALVGALLGLSASISFAQTKPAAKSAAAPDMADRQLFSVTEAVVKADKVQEYERLIKEEVNPALKKAGYTARNVFTRGTFGEANTYFLSTPIENYARYDQPSPVIKSMGEAGFRAIQAKLAACTLSSRTFAIRSMPDISHSTGAEMNIAVITIRELAPGKKAEWRKFMKDEYLPVLKTSESLGFTNYETTFGGSPNEITTIALLKNYAELDGPLAVTRKIGAEGFQKLMDKQPPGLTLRSERWILRFRKELSIVADTNAKTAMTSGKK